MAVLEFKYINGLAPDYLGKYFVKRSAIYNKNTRGWNNFVVPWYVFNGTKGISLSRSKGKEWASWQY